MFVFEAEKAPTEFLDSGWSGSGQVDAAAKVGDKAEQERWRLPWGVCIHQITKSGLDLQVTLQDTKYTRTTTSIKPIKHGNARPKRVGSLGEQIHSSKTTVHEVALMQQKMRHDQEALNDAGLIALLSQTEQEIEEHGESNQLNLLVRDFARELLKYRLLGIAQLGLRMAPSPAKIESACPGYTQHL